MEWIGLTGGIGSGKSTVARMLTAAGIDVVDADKLARDAVAPGSEGLAAIAARFGDDVLDDTGALDRPALGALVFSDDDARADLNAIVHPRVAQLAMERAMALEAEGKARMVYEVPLLFENGLDQMMAGTILVAVPREVQLARILARDELSEAEANARIDAQMSLEDKRARATCVVDNSGERADTARQLREAWRALTGDDVAFEAA